MNQSTQISTRDVGAFALYAKVLKATVLVLAVVAGAGIVTMMLVTCLDVILRIFRSPLIGAYDIVKIAGTITIAAALPYTTAVKGHVAIEYFFLKLPPKSRMAVNSLTHLLSMILFTCLTWQSINYGMSLKQNGQVTSTLQLPVYWVLYILAFSCAVVVLVISYHLLRPGKEMIEL